MTMEKNPEKRSTPKVNNLKPMVFPKHIFRNIISYTGKDKNLETHRKVWKKIKILRLTAYEDNGRGIILQGVDDKTPPFEEDFYQYLGKDDYMRQNTPLGQLTRNIYQNEKIPKFLLIKNRS